MNEKFEKYIRLHSKKYLTGFVLTLLFGPLGLFYMNWIAGLILTLFCLFTFYTIIIPIICWLLSMLISFILIYDYNKKLRSKAELDYLSKI